MENNITFSICIPNYNYANFIGETIESVLSQEFEDFELIICDNCSTDNSWEVIQKYESLDGRVRIYRNSINIGFAPNLQRVTEYAKGEFILLLSSDDLMRKGALNKVNEVIVDMRQLGLNPSNAVFHTASTIINQFSEIKYYVTRFRKNTIDDFFITVESKVENNEKVDGAYIITNGKKVLAESIYTGKSPATFCSTFFSRDLLLKSGGYDTAFQIIPDTIFLYRMYAEGASNVYIKSVLFDYRIHENSQLGNLRGNSPLKTQLDAYLFLIRYPASWMQKNDINIDLATNAFIKYYCFNEAIISMAEFNFLQAYKKIMFAKACFPMEVLKNIKYYLLILCLVVMPISFPVLFFIKKLRNKV